MAGITLPEVFEDLPQVLDVFQSAEAAVNALKAGPITATAVVKNFGLSGVAASVAAAYDQAKSGPVTIDEVSRILGIDPAGPTGKLLTLVETVIAQSKS
jgi:hypothetical protein